jgi:hypothetical protein
MVKTWVKYKCIKTECPECGDTGSLQLFINKSGKITYARVRHHQGKGEFTYCRLKDLEALKTLLNGQNGQGQTQNNIDPKQKDSCPKPLVAGPVGFEPTTFSLEG